MSSPPEECSKKSFISEEVAIQDKIDPPDSITSMKMNAIITTNLILVLKKEFCMVGEELP